MAFLLDTNVVSELRKGTRCSPAVRAWYDAIPSDELFLSVLVFGELRRGVEKVRKRDPVSARRLEVWVNSLKQTYAERIFPVTLEISDLWGSLSLEQPLPFLDGFLAATALHHGLTVVTRNTRDFQRCGVDCINPFES